MRRTMPVDTALLRALRHDQRGGVLVLTALAMSVLIGCTALAVDAGLLYVTRAQLQSTADMAALASASQLPDVAATEAMAQDYASKNMAVDDHGAVLAASDIVVGTWDPSSRTFDPDGSPPDAVRLTTRRSAANGNPVGLFFARALGYSQADVVAKATAIQRVGQPICLLSLEPSASDSLYLDSNATIVADDCAIQVNSGSAAALSAQSNSHVTATETCVNGSYAGGVSHYTPTPETGCDVVSDPLAGLTPPPSEGCDETGAEYDDATVTLTPGVYCDGLLIKNNSNITLAPGVYVIKDAPLHVDSNASISGTGVGFYLTDGATIFFDSNSSIDLTAPASGPLAGLLFYQNPSEGGEHRIDSNSANRLEGTVYLPNGDLRSDSNSTISGSSAYTILIARTFEFNSNAALQLNSDFATSGVPLPPGLQTMLRDTTLLVN